MDHSSTEISHSAILCLLTVAQLSPDAPSHLTVDSYALERLLLCLLLYNLDEWSVQTWLDWHLVGHVINIEMDTWSM